MNASINVALAALAMTLASYAAAQAPAMYPSKG
jgi:hypothetical protein